MDYTLVPFRPCNAVDELIVEISIAATVDIEWSLRGAMDNLRWPSRQSAPGRETGLWEHTCFECFLGNEDSSYVEFNLSPSGNWNCFAFDGLREGMRETAVLECTSSQAEIGARQARVKATLEGEVPQGDYWLGLSAVIETTDGGLVYFALAHNTPRPDFHDRRNHVYLERHT